MTEVKKTEKEIMYEELHKDGWDVETLHPRFRKVFYKINNAKTIREKDRLLFL